MNNEIGNTLLGKLKPGDHIASGQFGVTYEHHGIYIGQGADEVHKVIYFKESIKDSKTSCPMQYVSECTICHFKPPEEDGRVISCLECFRRGLRVHIVKYNAREPLKYSEYYGNEKPGMVLHGYRTNVLYKELYEGARLYAEIPPEKNINLVDSDVVLSKFISCKSPEQVLEAAYSDHYFGKYHVEFNNSEDFAVYCMTGKERSIQTEEKYSHVLYMVRKTLHQVTDGRKMKEKFIEKTLRFFPQSS